MTCMLSGSEVLVLSRVDFYRTFKNSAVSWNHSLRQAKIKEREYVKRCRKYLDVKQLVMKESLDAAQKQGKIMGVDPHQQKVELLDQLSERKTRIQRGKRCTTQTVDTNSKERLDTASIVSKSIESLSPQREAVTTNPDLTKSPMFTSANVFS